MGRLTRRAEADGVKAVWYGKRDVFLEGEVGYAEADKLAHYEDLEEQGRLIELPCAVGDTVYLIEEGCEDIYLPSTNYYYIEENPFDAWMLCGVGETVFLTKEEAEAKLEELKGE